VVGGARTIRIERPRETPVRLRVAGGAGGIELDGQVVASRGGDLSLDSRDWTGKGDRYSIEVVGGSKSVEVVAR
jgi:hypothetical protein